MLFLLQYDDTDFDSLQDVMVYSKDGLSVLNPSYLTYMKGMFETSLKTD